MELKTDKEKLEYREYLEKLADSKSQDMFSNGGKDYAVILYTVLLSKTSKTCRFYCEACDSEIWRDKSFQTAVLEALSRDNLEIKILTRHKSNPNFAWIPKEMADKVKLASASVESNDEIRNRYKGSICNFSMFDQSMFRYEYDIEAYKAYGSFNNPLVTAQMIELFDDCFNRDYHCESA